MRTAVRAGLIIMASCVSQLAHAQPPWEKDPPPRLIEDKFRVEVNIMGASYDTIGRVDPDSENLADEFSAEDDLKIDDFQYLINGEITLLPGKRHLLRLGALSTQRTGQTRLQRDINYDDQLYEVDELVDSSLNLRLFGLAYGFRLITTERFEVTPTIGFQFGEYSTNAVVRSRVTRDPTGDIAPVPLIGLDLRADVSRRWSVEGRVQYVKAELDDIEASVLDWRLSVTWRMNPHFLAGLGYRSFNIHAESFDDDSSGLVDLSITGPLLFIRASL